jgi:hypothetical protein
MYIHSVSVCEREGERVCVFLCERGIEFVVEGSV